MAPPCVQVTGDVRVRLGECLAAIVSNGGSRDPMVEAIWAAHLSVGSNDAEHMQVYDWATLVEERLFAKEVPTEERNTAAWTPGVVRAKSCSISVAWQQKSARRLGSSGAAGASGRRGLRESLHNHTRRMLRDRRVRHNCWDSKRWLLLFLRCSHPCAASCCGRQTLNQNTYLMPQQRSDSSTTPRLHPPPPPSCHSEPPIQ